MKMQNAIPSPVDGAVIKINFESGAAVKAGDVLAVVA